MEYLNKIGECYKAEENCDAVEIKNSIKYSILFGDSHVRTINRETTFGELEASCANPEVRQCKKGSAFAPATFKDNYRNVKNADFCGFIAFDFDDMPDETTATVILSCIKDIRCFCYSTFSHKLPNKGHRFRLVVAVNKPIPAKYYEKVARLFSDKFSSIGGKIDKRALLPDQYLYFPACPKERIHEFEFESQLGIYLEWELILDNKTEYYKDEQSVSGTFKNEIFNEGNRNESLFKIALEQNKSGVEEDELTAFLIKYNTEHCLPPLEEFEVVNIVNSVVKIGDNVVKRMLGHRALTELVLAEAVCDKFIKDIRWIAEWKTWVRFNKNNGKWEKIDDTTIKGFIIDELKDRRNEESEFIKNTGVNRSASIKEIERAERSNFISGVESLLKITNKEIIHPSRFDSNPYIVGLDDGYCFDLQNGEIRITRPDDYITKSVKASYDKNATCPLWEKSLLEWCRGDQELVRFLQTWCGYSLSGLTEFQGFLFLYGEGRNGKSVFVNIMSELLGKYAITINPDSLMLYNQGNRGASGDIARLVGARLATSIEMQEGKHFDENLLKSLTGGDQITARHLYEREFTFKPSLKLMISGNHKPIVKGSDFGFWRRMNLVPFKAKIKNIDHRLFVKLMGEKSGILNWCLSGWDIYNKHGLVVPEIVEKESIAYKEDMDLIKMWKDECVETRLDSKILAGTLYTSYREWSIRYGYPPVSMTIFGGKVKNYLESSRGSGGNYYLNCIVK